MAIRQKALPEQKRVAKAWCAKCKAIDCNFVIYILACGCPQACCAFCDEVWEAPGKGSPPELPADQAMAEGRDVGADVVSKEEG